MDESEYLSIPAHYMKEIPKDVWYSWPMEIRKNFFQMISDPNFFFYNNRPFNQEVHGENVELNDYEKKDFWKRVEYFFSKLGIGNLRSLDSLWGYFAIPFKYRTGQILKYYFYLPENKRKLLTTLTDHNIGGNSKSLVKINLIEKEAHEYIISFIHDFINSTTRQPYTVEPPIVDARYMLPPNQAFIPNYNIANENQIKPKININLSDNHALIPTSNNYTIGKSQQELPIGYLPTVNNEFISYYDQGQNQSLESSESQNQSNSANVEQFGPNGEKRGRGRPRKYPAIDPPPVHIPKKRGRKKKSELETENFVDMSNKESGNISQVQQPFNQIGNHEQNKIIVLSSNNSSTENENQKDQSIENTTSEIDKNDESSSTEKYDDETEDSEQMLRKFIVSDSSYSYDSDDKDDDDEYRETRVKPKSSYSLKGRKKTTKTKKQLQFSNFGPQIPIEPSVNLNENNQNYTNPQGYDYRRFNNGFNNFNSFNNEYNQFYNRGLPNMSIISIQQSPTNNTRIFKFNQPLQFIHDNAKVGIQAQQPSYPSIYQMQTNRFQSIQPTNEIKIVAITPINPKNIPGLSNAQKASANQKSADKPAKKPTKNYPRFIARLDKPSFAQSTQSPQNPTNAVAEHTPSLPTKPPPPPSPKKSVVDNTPSLPTKPPPPPSPKKSAVDHTPSLPTKQPPQPSPIKSVVDHNPSLPTKPPPPPKKSAVDHTPLLPTKPPPQPSPIKSVVDHAPSLPTKPPPPPSPIKSVVDYTPSLPNRPPSPKKSVVDHTPSLPTNPPPPVFQDSKKAKKYHINKLDVNIPQQEIILSPVKEPEIPVKKPNYSFVTDKKPPITSIDPNPTTYYQTLQSKQRKATESLPKQKQKQPIQDFHPIKQQMPLPLPLPFEESNHFQMGIKKNQQVKEYDSDSDSYSEENLVNDGSNQNYSSSNNESGKITFINQNQKAQFNTEESSDESDNQNEEADTEMNDYYDNDYENSENEIEKPNDEEIAQVNPTLQMRQRRPFHKTIQYSEDDNDDEPTEITGIISSLTYFYDECSNTSDSSRISKLKPSSLIDLEFKQQSS